MSSMFALVFVKVTYFDGAKCMRDPIPWWMAVCICLCVVGDYSYQMLLAVSKSKSPEFDYSVSKVVAYLSDRLYYCSLTLCH